MDTTNPTPTISQKELARRIDDALRLVWPCGGHSYTSGLVCGACHQAEVDRLRAEKGALADALRLFVEDSDRMRAQWNAGDWRAVLDLVRRHVESARIHLSK